MKCPLFIIKSDSIKFKKQASKCEVAAKLAEFLEASTLANLYDFVLPELLYFRDEKTLLGLRENPDWQALEIEFKAVRGLISEDWE